MNKALYRSIKQALREIPKVQALISQARKGQVKKGWYARARREILARYGQDADLFAAILAATSPRQSVQLNLIMAMQIYAAWDLNGRPQDGPALDEIAALGDLEARFYNVKRALRGEPLSGRKVQAFYANLSGDLSLPCIDTWMLVYAGIRDRGAQHRAAMSKGFVLAYQARIRKAARILGWEPAEVQECIWSAIYAEAEEVPLAEVPEFFYEKEVEEVLI